MIHTARDNSTVTQQLLSTRRVQLGPKRACELRSSLKGFNATLCAFAVLSITASVNAQSVDAGPPAIADAAVASATPAAVSIAPIDPAELNLIRPLLSRGPVLLPRAVDQYANSRPTIYLRINAPMATVHRVIRTPQEYQSFVPALSGVELQGSTGRRTAFRFRATAMIFDVRADVRVNAVSDHRVDVDVNQSDFGPAGTRWELFSDGPNATIAALTVWCDPSRATWAIRQYANSSAYSASSANITAETVLGLAVKRRAEILSGSRLPVRPASPTNNAPTLTPPPVGPWMEVLRSGLDCVSIELDANGSMRSITASRYVASGPDLVRTRLMSAEGWGSYWLWMRDIRVVSRDANHVRISTNLGTPLAAGSGEVEARLEPNQNTIYIEGRTGSFTQDRQRWDIVPASGGGTFVMYTGYSDEAHAAWFQHILMDRDVWAVAGLSSYWKVVMIRYGLWAM
jgi:hypothetical protein